MSQEDDSAGADSCFAWSELQIMLLKSVQECSNVLNMKGGDAVEQDFFVRVLCDLSLNRQK